MARVKITAKDITEGAASPEEAEQLSEGEESLSNADADPSKLMKKEKPAQPSGSDLRSCPQL